MNLYLERQKSIPWLLYLLFGPTFVVVWIQLYGTLKDTAPNSVDVSYDWLPWIATVFFGVGVPIILLLSQQITRINKDRIYITFLPFWRTSFAIADIEKCFIRQFNPYSDFGWGVRKKDGVLAITSPGTNKGLQFELKSGKKYFIGSAKINTFNTTVRTHLYK